MEIDRYVALHEEIQIGIADLEAGRVHSGKQVLDDLAFAIAVKQDLAEIQEGKSLSVDGAKKYFNLE